MAKERIPTKTETHYQTLQIDADAKTDLIDLSFRRLAKKYHPDYNPSEVAMGKMQELNGAYSVLRHRKSRRAYDSELAAQASRATSRFGDRSRNSAFMICLLILAGLIFQFFNPAVHTVAISTESPFATARVDIAQGDAVDNDSVDDSAVDNNSVQDNALLRDPNGSTFTTDASGTPYLSRTVLSTLPSESPESTEIVNAVASEGLLDNQLLGEADLGSNGPKAITVGDVVKLVDVSHEALQAGGDFIDTAQVDTAQVDTTQVDTTQVEPAPRTDTVNIDETNIDETLGEQTVKMGRTLSLVPVESVTVEVEPIAPKTIESQEKQAISQLVPTATFVPTSTPVSTPSPTQVPAQVLPAPTLAPTQAPIVQVIAQSASPTIIIQQAAMRSSSSSSFAQNGSIRLLNPIDGINGRKRQTFEWSADFVPGPNQGFELIFWKPGQDPWDSGFGLAAPTTESSITVNLDELDETLGTMLDWGQYRWGVLLVEREPYRRIVLLGTNGTPESRAFLFTNYKSAEHQVEHQSASAQGSP